jgi:hypothetical protein
LNRDKAIYLLKEIYDRIPELAPQMVNLIKTSTSCTIEFRNLGSEYQKQVMGIASAYDLGIKEKGNCLFIEVNAAKLPALKKESIISF